MTGGKTGQSTRPEDIVVRRRLSRTAAAMTALAAGLPIHGLAAPPERVALVIGNQSYQQLGELNNPVRDAEAMEATLDRLGFSVTTALDATKSSLDRQIEKFASTAERASVGLVFYAGHGVEVDGKNYLLPVDMEADHGQVQRGAMTLDRVLRTLEGAHTRLVLLDACRNDPFPKSRAIATTDGPRRGGGWSSIRAGGGTLVLYGTEPGQTASDGPSGPTQTGHGPFTLALLESIETPGLEVSEVMRRVVRRVRELTDNRQSPILSASYVHPFYFVPKTPSEEPPPPPPPPKRVANTDARYSTARAAYERRAFDTAYRSVLAPAREGHPKAQYLLGKMVLQGRGTEKSMQEALRWFEKAAEHGHGGAQFALGVHIVAGIGRKKDVERAFELFHRAAEQGHRGAAHRIAVVYEHGKGSIRIDTAQAIRWYRMAAGCGHERALVDLRRLAERSAPAKAALRNLEVKESCRFEESNAN